MDVCSLGRAFIDGQSEGMGPEQVTGFCNRAGHDSGPELGGRLPRVCVITGLPSCHTDIYSSVDISHFMVKMLEHFGLVKKQSLHFKASELSNSQPWSTQSSQPVFLT